jgi:hypothetical protein
MQILDTVRSTADANTPGVERSWLRKMGCNNNSVFCQLPPHATLRAFLFACLWVRGAACLEIKIEGLEAR